MRARYHLSWKRPASHLFHVRFEVSGLAAQWRLYSFGLITDPPA